MEKRFFFYSVLVISLLAMMGCIQEETVPPNVILIMTDDQGYGDMSCHGHPKLQTPNIDKISKEGVSFSNFHVDPYCAPTRAALMTGRYALRTGVWHTYGGRNWLFEDETTMAEIFKANGYATGHFGKWHLGDNYPFAPQFRGFDVSFALGNSGLGASDDYWNNDRFDDTYFLNGEPVKTKGFGTDRFVDEALDFIKENKEGPFFVYLAMNIVHRPWNIPPEYVQKYDSSQKDPPLVLPYMNSDMARFYGTIDKIDEQIGRVLNYLDDHHLVNNTIVIFLTDNGTVSAEYNAGMRGRKGSPYEGGHRVPLFIRWPKGKLLAGQTVNQLTAHLDLLPTLIGLCGLHSPKDITFDGLSLEPLLREGNPAWPQDRIYITQMAQSVPGGYHVAPPKWGNSAVLSQKWRLVDKDELYDIQKDPGQEDNIAPQYPAIVKKLQDRYEKYWTDIWPYTEKIARISIGHPAQPLTKLSLAGLTPPQGQRTEWSQDGAAQAPEIIGKWPIYVAIQGKYEFELRRWPRELNQPINAFKNLGSQSPIREYKKDAVQITPVKARIKIGNDDMTRAIDPGKVAVIFTVELNQGPADLYTWFIDANGTARSAYWIYIKKIN
jgi:arylsulfatase A-like enzyme